mmetsp:Transcript_3006/g.4629  ORF Transcript_3006/g.4629 Transcript_3006/m.4629 type:complete len:116 (-) Transcript_3006:58-405(-)
MTSTGGVWHFVFLGGCSACTITNTTSIATPKSGGSCCVLFLLECSDAFLYRSHFRDSIAGTERSRRAAAAVVDETTQNTRRYTLNVGDFKLFVGVFVINIDELYHHCLSELITTS